MVYRTVNFELNGKSLTLISYSGTAVYVLGGAELNLLDPANGEFNVIGSNYGIHVTEGKATVTNAKATGSGSLYAGAVEPMTVGPTASLTITGDAVSDGGGVCADYGGSVKVNGNVIAGSLGVDCTRFGHVAVKGDVISGKDGVHAIIAAGATIDGKITVPPDGKYIRNIPEFYEES